MIRLHLGVVDIPYSAAGTSQVLRTARWRLKKQSWQRLNNTTTGDVAVILEHRYGVMATFIEMRGEDVGDAISQALVAQLESQAQGAPLSNMLLPEGSLSAVEELFRDFLDRREMDGQVAGVPTAAAQRGVSHRFSHPYARRAARPSFIDTGTYQASFRAWAE